MNEPYSCAHHGAYIRNSHFCPGCIQSVEELLRSILNADSDELADIAREAARRALHLLGRNAGPEGKQQTR